ncbi:MAG: putative protease inhibitor [Myxococcaceae bacterium]|nr:putative protease inhibitor [Myxococcaceae bacterium]
MRLVSLVALVGIAALSTASLVACGGTSADEPTASGDPATDDGAAEEIKASVIDESMNGKTVPVTLGKTFTIALSDNASTGYVWSVKSVDKTIGAPKETTVPGDSSRPGSSGLKKFTWSTKSPLDLTGKHTIVLLHSRAFGNSPTSTFTVTIEIKDNKAASFCGGLIGKTCGSADTYCDYAIAASCGAGDQTGKCDAKPQFCPAVIIPVCGCDGKTYNNSCEANRSGVSISKAGACAH